MADNLENRFQQRTQRINSSAAGWIIGVVIAVLAIAAIWYYGTRNTDMVKTTSTTPGTVTTEQPAPQTTAPATPDATSPAGTGTGTGTTTGTGGTTTAPATPPAAAPAPAPAPAPANP